jgi:uncharacterized protein (TIGR02145 family)
MKKILLLMMCCPMILSAQNGVTVSGLDVKPGTVTFNVSWNNNQPEDFLWSDSVWVFVDYNHAGRMERLPVTSATATAGTVTKIQGNDKGVWVIGNARSAGSFSATVQLYTATADLHGVCAYASNYPPVGKYTETNKISFTGTPPYDLVLTSAGSGTYTYSINDSYYHLHEGETFKSFSDKTGAPGTIIIKCHELGATGVTFAKFNPCVAPYGSTYTLTDDRDQKTYKVKYMPDNRWWMVQDLAFGEKCEKTSWQKLTTAGNITNNGTYYGDCVKKSYGGAGYTYNGTAAMNYGVTPATYTCSGTSNGATSGAPATCIGICPAGWHLPTIEEWQAWYTAMTSYSGCTQTSCAVKFAEIFPLDFDSGSTSSGAGTETGYWTSSKTNWYIRQDDSLYGPILFDGYIIFVRCKYNLP